jgi:hypothetical protein
MAGRPRKITEFETIQKVETFNGEEVPEVEADKEGSIGWRMTPEEKLQSVLNSVKILPPNMIKDGRHSVENVQALNCFKVTEEMLDKVYANFVHEVF